MDTLEMNQNEKLEAEIVIIGGGGAGLAAALSAQENGCNNIIVLEKMGATGGTSAMAHDLFGTESPVQKQFGSDARRDDFFKVAMRWSHWSKVNPRIVRAFMDKSGDTIGWLMRKGITFTLGQFYLNQSPRVRHYITGRGAELMRVLVKECKEKGIKVMTHTAGKEILLDKNGRITGVMAVSCDKKINIKAKSVVVTTGGYAANTELLQKYCAYYNPETMPNQGLRHNTGDGIKLAAEVGAASAGLGHIMFHGPHSPSYGTAESRMRVNVGKDNEAALDLSKLVWEPQTLWVNKRGLRFIDEGYNLSSFAHANAVAQQPEGLMYCLFDDNIRKNMEKEGLLRPAAYGGLSAYPNAVSTGMPLNGLGKELEILAEKVPHLIKKADTIDEIGGWMGVQPEVIKAEVAAYNAACEKSYDSLFCKDRTYLLAINQPPYYAIKGQSFICDAIGGIKINERMEVLDKQDDPIPGLFAGGSTTGCWESDSYCYELTGHLLGFAVNSGRIAGENAVKYLAEEAMHGG
jgi:fumarate reductase flavoprotein subunit